jgi:hypothetical protein
MLRSYSLNEGHGLYSLRKPQVLCQGTTLQLAEKLWFLKGTSFSSYVRVCTQVRL